MAEPMQTHIPRAIALLYPTGGNLGASAAINPKKYELRAVKLTWRHWGGWVRDKLIAHSQINEKPPAPPPSVPIYFCSPPFAPTHFAVLSRCRVLVILMRKDILLCRQYDCFNAFWLLPTRVLESISTDSKHDCFIVFHACSMSCGTGTGGYP